MIKNKLSWEDYYKDRNCAEYLAYFEKEYIEFIGILASKGECFFEAGCGIGTVSKILHKKLGTRGCSGFDINQEMLKIGNLNPVSFFCGNIFDKNSYLGCQFRLNYVIHSHGVLEHFNKCEIIALINLQRRTGCPMVHWVPTDAYKEPSFGDEMLLSVQEWVKLLNPTSYSVDGKGLICVWEKMEGDYV